MRYLLVLPIVYLAAVLDTSLVDTLRVGRVAPDLLALTALVCVLSTPGPRAFLLGGAIMLLGDLVAPGRVGVGAAWMLLLGYTVTRLRHQVRLDCLALRVATVGIVVACWAAGVATTDRLLGELPMAWASIGGRAAGVGVYTAGAALPVLMVLGWIREPAASRQCELSV